MVAERTAAASELSKTTAPHGITGQEIKRFDGVVHFMKKHCTGGRQLWWVSVAHGSSREFIDKVWKRITNLQRDNRLPPYRAMTLEARGGLHAHIVFVGNRNIADRLKGSAALGDAINVGKVYNSAGLAHGYLAKERTPQASFHRPLLGGRIKGSHRLEGGGDRVRLSEPLKHHAIAAGYVRHELATMPSGNQTVRATGCARPVRWQERRGNLVSSCFSPSSLSPSRSLGTGSIQRR